MRGRWVFSPEISASLRCLTAVNKMPASVSMGAASWAVSN